MRFEQVDKGKWHRWFAWYPVRVIWHDSVDGHPVMKQSIVWLEMVQRKCNGCFGIEYRFPYER